MSKHKSISKKAHSVYEARLFSEQRRLDEISGGNHQMDIMLLSIQQKNPMKIL